MSSVEMARWHEANQRFLVAAVGMVREALERHARGREGGPEAAPTSGDGRKKRSRKTQEPAWTLPVRPALENLCVLFNLSAFERSVVLLCAGVELDGTFAAQCAAAQGDTRRAYPTFGLALAALPEAHWSALAPAAPLRRWRLVEVGAGETLTTSPLRIDERVLHYLAGVSYPDERLQGVVEPVPTANDLAPSHRQLAQRITQACVRQDRSATAQVFQVSGEDHAAKRAVVAAACVALDVQLYALRSRDIPAVASERELLARLWIREAALSRCVLMVDGEDVERAGADHPLIPFLESLPGPVFVAAREPLHSARRTILRFDVERPSAFEQEAMWQQALGPLTKALNGQVEPLVAQFNLSTEGIRAASAQAREHLADNRSKSPGAVVWDACRIQARPALEDLAVRIEPAATWDDLVLPELQRQMLRDIAVQARQRFTVYERWGFAAGSGRGLGISALFAGLSGTGKTMAAEVLADELRLDLYRIDLSSVVSKYIGETEKNLRRIFDAAELGGAILLFDEADALFGKRSEVKDSHDRYANIEVSYLLQRMEAYRGLAILTTNMKDALDTAFLRRIRFVVQFPFPDPAQRAEIWRRVFPPGVPTADLAPEKLARLGVAGGNIRNIALHAAFLAADAGQPVQMAHLLRAARSEYAKLDRALSESEVAGWT